MSPGTKTIKSFYIIIQEKLQSELTCGFSNIMIKISRIQHNFTNNHQRSHFTARNYTTGNKEIHHTANVQLKGK